MSLLFSDTVPGLNGSGRIEERARTPRGTCDYINSAGRDGRADFWSFESPVQGHGGREDPAPGPDGVAVAVRRDRWRMTAVQRSRGSNLGPEYTSIVG